LTQSAEKLARELADLQRRLGGLERNGQFSRSTITVDGETYRLPAALESGVKAGQELPVVQEGLTALEIAQEELKVAAEERDERLAQAETDLSASAERLAQAEADINEVFGTAGAAATAAAAAQTTADAAKTAANTAASAASTAQSTANTAQSKADTAQSAADAAASAAASAAGVAASKGDVLIQNTTPSAGMQKSTTLWIDTTNNLNAPKRWSGSAWVVVTDKAATDAAAAAATAKSTADAAKSAAATAQTAADNAAAAASAAQSVANAASGKADEAKTAAATAQSTADAAKTDAATAKTNAANAASAAATAQSAADTAKSDAAAAAGLAGSKADVLIQSTAPTVAFQRATTLWIDTTNNLNTPKRWNSSSSAWIAVTDKAATDAAAAAAAAQSTANTAKSDAASAKSAADAAAAAAAAAQSKADAAHSLAGTAESNAQAAISSAAGAASAASAAQSTADTAKSDAASAAGIANGKADVLIQSTTPATSMRKSTTLWIDTTNGLNAPKRWSGSAWLVVTDKAATDAASAAATAQSTADAAKTAAQNAQSAADNASKNLFSTAVPSGVAPFGSTWFRVNASGEVIGQWQQTATGIASTWTERPIRSEVIANLDVGKLTAGTANIVTAVAQKIAASTATFQTADIANLYASTATMSSAVAEKIFAAKVSASKILAEEVLIGAGFNLIANGRGEQGDNSGWASSLTWDGADAPTGLPGSFVGPNSGVTVSSGPNSFAVEPSTYYTFEVWLKADKPNSVLYIELRDQAGNHGGSNAAIPGETYGGSGVYPIGGLVVPTTWTKYKARYRTNSTTQRLSVGRIYFNHANGTERTATVKIAGMSLMRGIDAALVVDGAIDGKVITGATVRTKATGARVQLDDVGFRAFNASNAETVRISATDGTFQATGALSSVGEGEDFFTGQRMSIKATLGNKTARNTWVGYDYLQPGVYFERDSGAAQSILEMPRVVSPRAADVEMSSAQLALDPAKPNIISHGSLSAGPGTAGFGSRRYDKTINSDGGDGLAGILAHTGVLTNEDALVAYVETGLSDYFAQYSLSIGGKGTDGTGAVVPTPEGVQLKVETGFDDPAPSNALVRIDRGGILDVKASKGSATARMYATGDGKLRLSATGGLVLESGATASTFTSSGTVTGATVKATGQLQGASASVTGNVQAKTLNGEPITYADITPASVTYATNYGPYAGFQAPAYYRDAQRVWLMGLLGTTVSSITLSAGATYQMATIPVAYAPAADVIFNVVVGPQMDQRTFIYVRASGSIEYYSPAALTLSKTNFYIGLEGVSWFRKG
jgi:hypothetical protein